LDVKTTAGRAEVCANAAIDTDLMGSLPVWIIENIHERPFLETARIKGLAHSLHGCFSGLLRTVDIFIAGFRVSHAVKELLAALGDGLDEVKIMQWGHQEIQTPFGEGSTASPVTETRAARLLTPETKQDRILPPAQIIGILLCPLLEKNLIEQFKSPCIARAYAEDQVLAILRRNLLENKGILMLPIRTEDEHPLGLWEYQELG
jgi:hypothetical protein